MRSPKFYTVDSKVAQTTVFGVQRLADRQIIGSRGAFAQNSGHLICILIDGVDELDNTRAKRIRVNQATAERA